MNWVSCAKKATKLVFINALVFAALISASEGVMYYLYRFPPTIELVRNTARYYYRTFEASIVTFEPKCAKHDPKLSYIFKSGSCTFANLEFSTTVETNSRGLRDDEDSLSAPEIIAVGDSFTMGWGVEQQEAFPQLIEAASGIKTLNTGIPSYGTAREFRLLGSLDTSKLKHLIVQYNANDIGENMSYMSMGNRLNIMRKRDYQFAREQRRRQLRPNYYFGKYLREFLPMLYKNATKDAKDKSKTTGEWRAGRKIIPEVDFFLNVIQNSSVDLRGVQLYVVDLSSYARNDSTFVDEIRRRPPPTLINFEHAPLAIKTLNISDIISEKDYYVLDSHLHAEGHRKLAEKLTQMIRETQGEGGNS